jgi:regulator of sigma E protease
MFDFVLGNDTLSAIVAFILVLIPAVLIHELGHFFAAKSVGITILEFGIFMPPRMIKLFTLGGTDYTLNWLPLGGFVRPLGEDVVRQKDNQAIEQDRAEANRRGIDKTMAVTEAKPLPRIFFFAGGALANFLFAFVLFVVIALMGIPEAVGGLVSVISIAPDSALAEAGVQPGDIIQSVNGEAFTDTATLFARLSSQQDEPFSLGVLRGDEGDPVTLTVEDSIPAQAAEIVIHPLVVAVSENSPAANADLRQDDLIVAFNGEPIETIEELQAATGAALDTEVTLTVLRAGELLDLTLTPRSNPPQGEGAIGISLNYAGVNSAVGLAFQEGSQRELVPQSFSAAVNYSLSRIGEVIRTIASIPGQLLGGTADPNDLRLTSPLGISQAGGVFLQESIERDQPGIILEFMALISLALGLTNLLPIPALDGGRILFVLIELVRGRPIAPEREGVVHLIGLALLLSLMVVVLLNDIANPLYSLLR